MSRLGKFFLAAICALMVASIGTAGVAAGRPASMVAGSDGRVGTDSPGATTVSQPRAPEAASSQAPCRAPGQPDLTTPANEAAAGPATLPDARGSVVTSPQSTGGPFVPRPCPAVKTGKTTADLAAAAASFRAATARPDARHPSSAATRPGPRGKAASAARLRPTVKPGTSEPAAAPAAAGHKVSGTVTNSGTAPLAGIEVDAIDNYGDPADTTTTNASGAFELSVAPGDYNIWFSDPAGTYATGYYGDSGFVYNWDPGLAAFVTVFQGDLTGYDVTLPLAVYVSGTVSNAGAEALPDIEVDIVGVDGWTLAMDVTGPAGHYKIEVEPGDYNLWFADAANEYATGYWAGGTSFSYDTPGEVIVSTSSVVADITLPAALHIAGTVTDTGLQPLEGISVLIGGYTYVGVTDAAGKYSIAVAPGSYTIWFVDDSGTYASGYFSTGGLAWTEDSATVIVVGSADVGGKNVSLPFALYMQGIVTDGDANPLEGVEVDVYDLVHDVGWDLTFTDLDGSYSVEVAPGSYRVQFASNDDQYASGYYSDTAGFAYDPSDATPVVVASDDVEVDISLPPAIQVSGRVTRSGGVALANIEVLALDTDFTVANGTTTDTSGRYSLSVGVGVYYVWFCDPSEHYGCGFYSTAGFTYFDTAATKLTVTPAGLTGKNVVLPVAIHIKGKVSAAGGTGLPGIRVDASMAGFGNFADTDVNGNYSIALAPGSYALSFQDPYGTYAHGYYSTAGFTYSIRAASKVAISSADVTGKNVTLPLAVFVHGTASASGTGAADVQIYVDTLDGATYGGATTDPDGNYAIPVAPGSYAVELIDPAGTYPHGFYEAVTGYTFDWDQTSPVIVSSSDVAVNLTIPAVARVSGRVTGTGGIPLSDVYVEADAGSYYNWVVTDSAGRYSIPLPAGSYTLSFYDPSEMAGDGYYSDSGFTYDLGSASPVVVASSNVSGLNVVLPTAIHITGTVTRTGGLPAASILVDATSGGYNNWEYTGENGKFSIPVAPGSYTLTFTDPAGTYACGYYSASGFTYLGTAATSVVVSAVDVTGKNVTLPVAVHIKGKVSKSGGAGLPGIEIQVGRVGSGLAFYGYSTADGTYSVAVAPGNYRLWFGDPEGTYVSGYLGASGFVNGVSSAATVAVAAADVTGKNVTLPAAVHIRGTVTRSGGLPVPSITVYADKAGCSYSALTDGDGTFSVPVSAGTYTLEFADKAPPYGAITHATGYYSTTGFTYNVKTASPVTVATADATGKNVVLPVAVFIKGKVTDALAGPLAGIEVDASRADGSFSNWTTTGADGTYSTEVAPSGSYKLWFRDHSGINGAGYYNSGGFVYDSSAATDVAVGSGSITGINVTMVAAPGLVFPASTYHAIPPARVLDTRPTSGAHANIGLSGVFTAGTVRAFAVADAPYIGGSGAAVPWNAVAVTGNLTIVSQTAAGLVALGPTMTAVGDVTTINFALGDIRANNVTVGLAPDGTLAAVYRSATAGATVHLILDVTGFFTPDTAGATYHALSPGRVLDSRPTLGGRTNIGLAGKFANKVVRNFAVAGVKALGWPSALVPLGATAVTGNLTVAGATSAGYVSLGPTMTTAPSTSTLNVAKGSNVANGVTVALNGGKLGAIWMGTTGSTADVIFDVTGYFTADTSGLSYHAVVPARLLDTAVGTGLTGRFTSLSSRNLTVGGVGDIPADTAGISGNLTVIGPSSAGYGFISPVAVGVPTSSTLNNGLHQNVANGFDVALSGDLSGSVALIWCGAAGATTDLQLDVTGYWK